MRLRVGAGVLVLLLLATAVVTLGGAGGQPWVELRGRGAPAHGDALDDVVRYVRELPPSVARFDIAATAAEGGHWRLANTAGEVVTAVGSRAFARALTTLRAGNTASEPPVRILLDSPSLFDGAIDRSALPTNADLAVLVAGRSFALERPDEAGSPLRIVLAPGLLADVPDRRTFLEVLRQVERPLVHGDVRRIALEPEGATWIARNPRVQTGMRTAPPDVVDPDHLGGVLGAIGGRMAVVSGRIDQDRLIYKPGSGASGEIALHRIEAAVRTSDASLVLLDAASARQPGTRNWLWQRIALSNMEKALGGATVGAFLRALAGEPEVLVVSAKPPVDGRVDLLLEPSVEQQPSPVARLTQVVSGTWSNIVSETAGGVSARAIRASMLTVARQDELHRRIIPGIPYVAQVGYLGLMIAGLLAFPIVNGWWCRIWPDEALADYGSGTGWILARAVRGLVLGALFLPAAGLAAVIVRVSSWRGAKSR